MKSKNKRQRKTSPNRAVLTDTRIKMSSPIETKSYGYAIEKLTTALECLATHRGEVRERLMAAFLIFHALEEKDFPPKYQHKWTWIIKELTKYGPEQDCTGEVWRGSVKNTMRRIHRSTASKIAKEIYELYWNISANKPYL
jgi:hypothetical protein